VVNVFAAGIGFKDLITINTTTGVWSINKNNSGPQNEQELLNRTVGAGVHSETGSSYTESGKTYKKEGGGTLTYAELVNSTSGELDSSKYGMLHSSAKSAILADMLECSNFIVDASAKHGINVNKTNQQNWIEKVQNTPGMGSEYMAMFANQAKPDFAGAFSIVAPFNGIIGTAIGAIALLIFALFGLTMVLDLAYIAIPMFRILIDGAEDTANDGAKKNFVHKVISAEAKSSVLIAEGGGDGGSGKEGKGAAMMHYLKKRAVAMIILGVCMLYLISGQLYTLVGWIIDLAQGLLNF
jgi:hypothetical protein